MAVPTNDLRIDDDGLICPEIGRWAETKYRLVSLYDNLFSTGMKDKWDCRVYIDLYSGAGFGRIKDTDICLKGSPILALQVPFKFDKYLFCEEDKEKIAALRVRASRFAPEANITYIEGKCDEKVEEILAAVPHGSAKNRVLGLCFVDPFDFGLRFETVRLLSDRYLDFLVLLAVGMDANRAYDHYVDGNNPKLDLALGNVAWRNRWKSQPRGRNEFPNFIAEEFAASMRALGYLKIGPRQMKLVRSDVRNLPLYYLALFSRHQTAYQFWDQVLQYATDQLGFNWE
jgi:three-Cys-motif partner protein